MKMIYKKWKIIKSSHCLTYINNMTLIVTEVGCHWEIIEQIVTETLLPECNKQIKPVKFTFVPVISFDDRPAAEFLQNTWQRIVTNGLNGSFCNKMKKKKQVKLRPFSYWEHWEIQVNLRKFMHDWYIWRILVMKDGSSSFSGGDFSIRTANKVQFRYSLGTIQLQFTG